MFITITTIILGFIFLLGLQRILKESLSPETECINDCYSQDFDRFEFQSFKDDLSPRADRALEQLEITTAHEMKGLTIDQILELKGVGKSTAVEITKFAKKYYKININ